MTTADVGQLGFWPAVAIGIGGMVGGGIFAVLGLVVQMARGGTPVGFALAGVVALLTTYSYAQRSVTYPSRGGTVTILNKVFGTGKLTGMLNVLLWLSYIVMLSLYAFAFGSYGATFFPTAWQALARYGLISLFAIAGLNLLSATEIGHAEKWIVELKVMIQLFFVGVGFAGIKSAHITPAAWAPAMQLVAGGMIILVACEGFEPIANTAQDVLSVTKTLPHAYYAAVEFVVALYVSVLLAALVWQTEQTAPLKLCVLAVVVGLAVVIEGGYRLIKGGAQRDHD